MQAANSWRVPFESTDDAEAARNLGDLEAVHRAKQDVSHFAPIYERYATLIHQYCFRRLGNGEDAADATSLVFPRAIAALGRFRPDPSRPGSTFRAWLFTIARNIVLDRVRRDRPQVSIEHGPLAWSLADEAASPEALAIQAEREGSIAMHLTRLPERQRAVVELRLADLSLAEIATALALSESAVKSLQFRAFKTLRDLLRERTS